MLKNWHSEPTAVMWLTLNRRLPLLCKSLALFGSLIMGRRKLSSEVIEVVIFSLFAFTTTALKH